MKQPPFVPAASVQLQPGDVFQQKRDYSLYLILPDGTVDESCAINPVDKSSAVRLVVRDGMRVDGWEPTDELVILSLHLLEQGWSASRGSAADVVVFELPVCGCPNNYLERTGHHFPDCPLVERFKRATPRHVNATDLD